MEEWTVVVVVICCCCSGDKHIDLRRKIGLSVSVLEIQRSSHCNINWVKIAVLIFKMLISVQLSLDHLIVVYRLA